MAKIIAVIELDKDEPYHRREYAKELAARAEAIAKARGAAVMNSREQFESWAATKLPANTARPTAHLGRELEL